MTISSAPLYGLRDREGILCDEHSTNLDALLARTQESVLWSRVDWVIYCAQSGELITDRDSAARLRATGARLSFRPNPLDSRANWVRVS